MGDRRSVNVFLMRHGPAVTYEMAGSDEMRWLSARGRAVVTQVAAVLHDVGAAFDAIVASPLPRAMQTAEIVAATLGYTGEVYTITALAPGASVTVAAQHATSRGQSVLLVGHEPSIAALGALLAARPAFPGFQPAQVCRLDSGRPQWTIVPGEAAPRPLLLA